MKVFTCDDFKGHYPVGTAAVVVAENIVEARKLLDAELARLGLAQDHGHPSRPYSFSLTQLHTSKPTVIILCDGNY